MEGWCNLMPRKRKDGYLKKSFTIDGKRYYVYGKNANELFLKEKAKREEIQKGFNVRKNPTVEEYYERWTEGRRDSVKESTLRGQIKMFEAISSVYIASASKTFGELKIKDVSVDDLRVVQKELAKTRRTQTVNDYIAHFKHCMNDALNERVIEYNPCLTIKNLKRTEEKARDTYHRALTIEEQKNFFGCERCQNSIYYNVFRFAILTGARVGEIGALRNSDIKDGKIHIERTITRTETGAYKIGDSAKTQAGRRTIPINQEIQAVLDSQRELNKILDDDALQTDDCLFKAPERGLLMATPIDREIKRICKLTNIEPFTMHAFRATFATRCIENGMNPRTVQELLGHSNFNITMSLYGHVLDDTMSDAMDQLHIVI